MPHNSTFDVLFERFGPVMSYKWECMPVAIRLTHLDEIHGLSGIHVVLLDSNTGNWLYDTVITFNSADFPRKNEYTVTVSTSKPSGTYDNIVNWYPVKIENHYPISLPALDQIHYFRQNGFNLIPQDIENASSLSVLKLGFINNSIKQRFYRSSQYDLIEFSPNSLQVGLELQIISSPFNFTNPLLFSNFHSEGTINYVLGDPIEPAAYLSDIRYLDNMIGGLVNFKRTNRSIGLVLGSLRKLNGDGDLTIILPWNSIWDSILSDSNELHLHKLKEKLNPILTNKLESLVQHSSKGDSVELVSEFTPPNTVFPLQVKERFRSSWGSCVYYSTSTIVTNYHVLKPYLTDPSLTIEIQLSTGNHIVLDRQLDHIITPSESDLDLSFIILSASNRQRLAYSSCMPAASGLNSYQPGDKVYSMGYGLFFNSKSINPVISTGSINATLKLPADLDGSSTSCNSIIVTSSSCWNGSSGGGLFNDKNQLIGLICSNAQVFVPSLEKLPKPKTEKLSKVSFVLPIDLIEYCYAKLFTLSGIQLNPQIGELWQLKNILQDVTIGSSKL